MNDDRKYEIREVVRKLCPAPDNESWGDFTDMLIAVSDLLEGAEKLVSPPEMDKRMKAIWDAYSTVWMGCLNRIVGDCVGGPENLKRIQEHPNGGRAKARILQRVKKQHGEITPGTTATVEVEDILLEELGDEVT